MKKIFLLLAFVWTVSVANAWTNACEEGIVIMAVQHLEPKAKAVVDRYLGSKYSDDIHYLYNLESKKKSQSPKEIHFVHFDENMQPIKSTPHPYMNFFMKVTREVKPGDIIRAK